MILKGNQRGGARKLAFHLTSDENDHVQVHEIRGFVADDLQGAFKESEALSKGTRCKQHLFSLSLNPPEGKSVTVEAFEKAINKAETKLSLTGQPRAIVFHEKEGRRHAHAVWSRIDSEKMKAVPLPHSKRKLNTLSKQLFLDHGWRLPAGYIDKQLTDPKNFTLDEWQQAKRIEKDPRQIKQVFQQAWAKAEETDTPADTFTFILNEQGYQLAQGNRRALVAVDQHGEIYSVPRQLGIKTKEVKAVLGGNLKRLPDANTLKADIDADMTVKLDGFRQAALVEMEQEKQAFKDKLKTLIDMQRQDRAVQAEHHTQRQSDEARIRQSRFRKGVKGLWDRLRGEHAKTAKQNELEALQAARRDQTEQEQLIRKHLWERSELKKEQARAKQRLKLRKGRIQQFERELQQSRQMGVQGQQFTFGKEL